MHLLDLRLEVATGSTAQLAPLILTLNKHVTSSLCGMTSQNDLSKLLSTLVVRLTRAQTHIVNHSHR